MSVVSSMWWREDEIEGVKPNTWLCGVMGKGEGGIFVSM